MELEKAKVPEEEVRNLLKAKLEVAVKRWGRRVFSAVYIWPSSPADVKEGEGLKAVFLDPAILRESRNLDEVLNYYTRYRDSAGEELRECRNTIVYLLPIKEGYRRAAEGARTYLACRRVLEAKEAKGLTDEDEKELAKRMAKIARALVRRYDIKASGETYRRIMLELVETYRSSR